MLLGALIAILLTVPPDPSALTIPAELATAQATTTVEVAPQDTDNSIACNCYMFVKSQIPSLPLMKFIVPNSPARKGAVAIYDYEGMPHYAVVESVQHDGTYGHWEKGSNLKPCQLYERFVNEDNPHLLGFWYPPSALASASP